MKNYSIRVLSEVEGKPLECSVVMSYEGKTLRTVVLKYGAVYKVIPDNPLKLKHRDKVGVLIGFKIDHLNNPVKARIKFDETERIGYVDLVDLLQFKNN